MSAFLAHCLSVADTRNRKARSPLAVTLTAACGAAAPTVGAYTSYRYCGLPPASTSAEEVTTSSSSRYVPVTKEPRAAMMEAGVPTWSMGRARPGPTRGVSLRSGDTMTRALPSAGLSNTTSVHGSSHLGWQ